GACSKSSIVRTPSALPAITSRSANFSFNTSTSSAAHIIYPTSFAIINKFVFGSSTRMAVKINPSTSNGFTVITCASCLLRDDIHYRLCLKELLCHFYKRGYDEAGTKLFSHE